MTISCRVEAKVTDFKKAPLFGIEHNGLDHTNATIMFPYLNEFVVFLMNGRRTYMTLEASCGFVAMGTAR